MFKKNKVDFYDDYAHHPTEIKSVLEAVRKVSPNRKITTIFQPHRFSRVRTLQSEFVSCFKETDLLILCPVYAAGESIDKKYNQVKFSKLISKFSKVQVVIAKDELDIKKLSKVFMNIDNKSHAYFIHSYEFLPKDKQVVSLTTNYGREIVAAVCYKNIYGSQFHPEKSQKTGIKILTSFLKV